MTVKLVLAIWVVVVMLLSALALIGPGEKWCENIFGGLVVFHVTALFFAAIAMILAWGMGLI